VLVRNLRQSVRGGDESLLADHRRQDATET
jgi:hypothetical protein